MASSKDRSKDDEICIPHDFVRSVQGWDDRFKQLQDNNEWLAQIDQRLSDSELSILRHAFLTDGHNFISFLTEYLNAVKWQEFIVYVCTQRINHVPVLMHLIYEASLRSRGTDIQTSVGTEPTNPVFNHKIGNLKDSKLLHQGCIEAIRNRYCESSNPVDESVAFYIRRSYLTGQLNGASGENIVDEIDSLKQLHRIVAQERDHFAGLTIETSTEADALITELEDDMNQVDRTHVDNMTFGYTDTVATDEPTFLSYSRRWNTIGKNLCDLGLRVGADVPRWPTQPKQWTIITALKAVINNEGPGINVMLARLEKYQVQIQKQQQVITALQFRHLLEHLPAGIRDRWLAGASSKSDEVSQASQWDRMKEVEKWREFWSESVRQIFKVYKEKGSDAWEGSEGHEPSPFANLLKYYLGKAFKKNSEQEAVRFLADETDIGERANKLYNTLSQIIHQYSDSSFEVNRLNFSPLDAHILTALVPKNARHGGRNQTPIKDESWAPLDEKAEIVAWKKEFRRYIWEKPADTQITTNTSDKELLDRLEGMWKCLLSKPPFSALFPKDLNILSAISDADAGTATVTATFLLAKKHINSCNMIHNAVLSAFFDAIGRMSLMAAGRGVTSDRVSLSVESSFLAHPGDEVQVTGTLMRDEQEQTFSTTIHMKTASDTDVASGYFKAYGVRETNGSEAYDSMI
ncbi:hypothetical protein FPOAC2_05489 [Fusarium poae]|uniref:Thioesterase domain-containing protein n=1 Tax=Fusarium poae TaxID=36050 RepID=A0A1B8AUV9_FUSPO|nr:hypothetical protein FPOAC1_005383 [Fusarium poae]KAG8672122.1 hypothetical protein FPOAC1_005383 [Fusarium poae]OBS24328.1 hypothetical protein FPOA_04873 [Fusarium poae]